MAFDTSDLWALIPNPLTVAYYVYEGGGEFADAETIDYGEKRPTDLRTRTALDISVDAESMTWHLWKNWLGEITPKIGDEIGHDGDRWRVISLVLELEGQRWRLICTKNA